MAYTANTNIYHSNAIQGWLSGIGESSVYDIDSRPKFAVGSGFKRQDGAIFRYANFVSATTQGQLASSTQSDLSGLTGGTTQMVITPAAALQMADEQAGVYPGGLGSKYIVVTLASVIVNSLAGGYLSTNSLTGYGYNYRIKRNTATSTIGGTSGRVLIELFDPLQVALDSTSIITIIGSLYNECAANAAGSATWAVPIGVTMANMTANTYGWVCTHGPVCVLQEGAIATGCPITPGFTTAGSVARVGLGTSGTGVTGAFILPIIGYCMSTNSANAAANYITAFMMIE